uniref:C-type lectin domain-containing protein n=1 Tax=Astyanax mexicanus TaxID=7994 RepID=A0A3B1KB72_ASTMX
MHGRNHFSLTIINANVWSLLSGTGTSTGTVFLATSGSGVTQELMVSVIWAEEDYFINGTLNYTWDNARNYCQICYKDLTTMTPGNAHIIIQKVIALNLTSGYWIGLRENFSGPIPFSQWSNGAPVIYQNWYPGRPILKKPEVFVPTSPPPTTSTDGTTTSYDSTTTAVFTCNFPNITLVSV